MGVGVTNNVISTGNDLFALQFSPQQTGFVTSIAVYAGALTNNPLITSNTNYIGQRRPWIVELIPVSGYDPGSFEQDFFVNTITASTDVLDEVFTTPEGDELNDINDGLGLFQSGPSPATATVQFNSTAFPLTAQVLSVCVEVNTNRQALVHRIDQSGSIGWTRLFPAGYSKFHMAEAYREQGTLGYTLWTPTAVRQFNSATGNRRLRFEGIDIQPMLYDYLSIHVDWVTERRAGVGVIVPAGPYEWSTATFVRPGTALPVPVSSGVEYMVVVRAPIGQNDYGSPGSRFDWRALNDLRVDGTTPAHYEFLDWDSYVPLKMGDSDPGHVSYGLDTKLQGLPTFRMLNSTTELVDSEPYSSNYSGVRPLKLSNTTDRAKHTFAIISGSTRYRYIKMNVSYLAGLADVVDPGYVNVQLVNSVGAVIAGPVQITPSLWDEAPVIGTDIWSDPYHQVTLDLGASVDIDNVTATTVEFILSDTASLKNNSDGTNGNPWRIGALVSEIIAATGSDQTAPSASSARGYAYNWADNGTVEIDSPGVRRGDLQVMLISEVPAITGASVTTLSQSVSGGVCAPCVGQPSNCTITNITYNHVCWSPTTLVQGTFSWYEVQRLETATMDAAWTTVAIIAPTGTVTVTGAAVTGVSNCFDDWTMVYDTEVCYRIRQRRQDGGLSDFVETVCITTPAPTGADLIITAPLDTDLNVAFAEAHGVALPIERSWEVLDSDQHVFRAVYGRDKYIGFRPLETLGLRFKRRIIVTALCTPVKPCIDVVHQLHEVCQATTGLVVRDQCGNRWYAAVQMPSFTQVHDPDLGDIWLADIVVTELTTPVVTPMNIGLVAA